MRVLWVCDEPPDRGRGGGSIRQAQLLLQVAAQAQVHLLVTNQLEDAAVKEAAASITVVDVPQPRRDVWRRGPDVARKVVSRDPVGLVATRTLRHALRRPLQHLAADIDVDVVCVEHEWLAPLVPAARDRPWSLTLHYLPSHRAGQAAAAARRRRERWRWRLESSRYRRAEQEWRAAYDGLVLVSPEDRELLGTGTVVPNGVDLETFRPSPVPNAPRLVITGSFDYEPNVQGAVWFVDRVLPLVQAQVPDVTLELVGRQPGADVLALTRRPGVALRADVPSVVPHLAAARVAVVPIHVGSGTRLKALEAMACGRPVVGTHVGLAGLDIEDGVTAMVATDPDALARAVVTALRDDRLAAALGRAGRAHAQARFGWDELGRRYLDHLLELASRRHSVSSPSPNDASP